MSLCKRMVPGVVPGVMLCSAWSVHAKQSASMTESLAQFSTPAMWLVLSVLGVALLSIGYLRWQLSSTRRALQKLKRQPMPHAWTHDELTGLPNLRLLHNQVQPDIARIVSGALIVLQVRHFEQVNRVLGYQHANLVLTQIAFRLNQQLASYPAVRVLESQPQPTRLCHIGGVEFALFVDVTGQQHLAQSIAQQVLRDVPEPLMLHGGVIDYQLDAGIALCPAHSSDIGQLVQQARMALHQQRWHETDGLTLDTFVYTPELTQFNQQRLAMMAQLQHALAQQQLQLDVQPQIDLQTGEVVAGEVLVRWQHPTQGLLMPKQFIPIAEQLGILYPLTCWILTQALDALQQLTPLYPKLKIAVNIASKDLLHQELVEFLQHELHDRQLHATHVVLEFREDALLQEPERALALLTRLADMGVCLALDDFGTGYTSLGMLREMPIQQVKVDCQFVSDVHRSDAQAAVTGAIIDMAKNMQWQVVAEGIEEQAAADKLARMGCLRGQGYLYSRPFALSGFAPWLAQYQHHRSTHADA